ncbi:hypothetical protein D3C78_1136220 [compost metagenome]
MIEQVWNDPAMPLHWGQNQPGMQAKEELPSWLQASAKYLWKRSARNSAKLAESLNTIGLHKQATNRLLEPFQMMKTVLTYTEGENFYWLRNHSDAQPEIKALASAMLLAVSNSTPMTLRPGEWHTPYYADGCWTEAYPHTLEEALAISSSCCAQVSYRLLDDSLDKALNIYARLVESEPVHASPFEHQATPMNMPKWDVEAYERGADWEEGVTHSDRDGNLWSGNLMGWIQFRQRIPNNVVRG